MANIFSRIFAGRARDKPGPINAVSAALEFLFGSGAAGKAVSPKTSMQLSTVYACVRVIAETVASLPLSLYRATGDGGEKARDDNLYWLLHDEPNPEMTSFTWRETIMTHLLLWGNSYNQIVRDGRGNVLALYPLLPDHMTVDRDPGGKLTYAYERDGTDYILKPETVLHIPGLGFDGVMGLSPIAMEKNALSLAIAAEEYGSKFFANGATPSGVLTHPGKIGNPTLLRESWNSKYGGSANGGKVAVLEEGVKFERISLPNSEAQFLESRKFQVEEICRMYRVPPHMVGNLEHATFSNIEHQSIDFATHTIRPWVVRIEQALNRGILPDNLKGQMWTGFNMNGLTRGAYKERMEGYAIGRQNGWLSANDIRALEDMNLIPDDKGGNEYGVNGNMVPLSRMGTAYDNAETTSGGKEE